MLIGSSSAVAASPAAHATHKKHISGVIVSINAARHTLNLRVTHGTKHHKVRPGHAASAGDSGGILVAFGDATVHGPNGAVAVGEDVTVTTTGTVGQTMVASAIDVIGQPNGGTAGKGAAVPGEVTAVDPTNGTLTLTVASTDSQGNSQDSSVIVNVSATTILAVGDTNGDGQVTVADVSVGDHVVVFTLDATANPLAAIGVLDASHAGGDHHGGGDGQHGSFTAIPGAVTGVDLAGQSLTMTVGGGALAGTTVTVDLSEHTSFGGRDSGNDGPINLSDISVGDTVTVYTRDATTTPVVAVGIVDNSQATGGDSSGQGGGDQSSAPSSALPTRFGGLVTAVRGDGLTVNVTSGGPLSGHLVVVSVPSTASLQGATGAGGGPESLTNISVGDAVEIFTHDVSGSPVVAVGVRDDSGTAGS
ncbi:MAG TPA: hypothetical protein VNC12_10750 [Solirubrobacteraceae bacterium]|nr:hypothetical protein [Solirubrobacteraceae bacterium]